MQIGDHIKSFRTEKGLSRQQFSEITKVSAGYIEEIESNKKVPTIVILKKISSAFNITVSELIGEQASKLSPEAKAFLDSVSDLSPEQQVIITKLIKDIKIFNKLKD